MLASIRSAGPAASGDVDHEQALAELRAQVPAEHRDEFDDAVEDAGSPTGCATRTGRSPTSGRRVCSAGRCSRRAAASKPAARAAARNDVFELKIDEIAALLQGRPGPGRDEIAERAVTRRWEATLDPPDRLGREEGPPPLAALTPYLAKVTRLVLTVVSRARGGSGAAPLTGLGIGAETYVGTARVVHDASEALAEMEPGDVVVTPYTAPTYNSVLAMAGAIVTEEGGLLCHAAVIAGSSACLRSSVRRGRWRSPTARRSRSTRRPAASACSSSRSPCSHGWGYPDSARRSRVRAAVHEKSSAPRPSPSSGEKYSHGPARATRSRVRAGARRQLGLAVGPEALDDRPVRVHPGRTLPVAGRLELGGVDRHARHRVTTARTPSRPAAT